MFFSNSRLSSFSKTFMYALAISTTYELIYYLYQRWKKQKKGDDRNDQIDVIFFPDATIACDAFFSYGCFNETCWLSHEETSSMKLIRFLQSAKKTLDICVYCIACSELVGVVVKAQKNGVCVRVITDQEQALQHEAQIGKLRAEGIEVRMNNSTFFMHHKFVLADSQQLITGSFNWSRNATLGNDENILFTSNRSVVKKYNDIFEKLWEKYCP